MSRQEPKTTQGFGPPVARLVMVEGPHIGERIQLSESTLIGRATQCDVCVEDVGVSREHARIVRGEGNVYQLVDLGSKNGTFINDRRVDNHMLVPADRIKLGPRATFVFGYVDPVEEQLRQRQRLETLGRALASIAHDLNNVVGALSANADYLSGLPASTVVASHEVSGALEDMRLAALQAKGLTRSVVNFARGKATTFGLVDVSALSLETLRLARHALGHEVTVETHVTPHLVVRGSQSELQQVIMNLLVNAKDAMPDGGCLRLSAVTRKGKDCDKKLDLEPSTTYAVIDVEDTGHGIDSHVLPHIFERFYTTKGQGTGSGIGLATVKEVVGLHKGRVSVRSQAGRGTLFSIYLPVLDLEVPARITSTSGKIPVLEGRREPPLARKALMIVDDDPLVRRAVARLLSGGRYELFEAESGEKAIERFRTLPRPDLVLMDLDMPGMGGDKTLEELQKIDPAVPIVVCTGRVDHDASPKGTHGAKATLQKPFSGDTLRATLAMLLEGTEPPEDELTQPHPNPRLDG